MRILVTRTTRAAPDGVRVTTYESGAEAEHPEGLARVFLREGWGRSVDEKDLPATPQNKALDAAPENKTPPNPPRARRRRRRRKRAPAGR